MAKLINNTTNLTVLAIIGILLFSCANKSVVGQCEGDMAALMTQCAIYVEKSTPKMPPSEGCCNVVKNADASCVCQHITKAMLQFVDMKKVIYVAKSCGKPIPKGTNCGGITVP